MRVNLNLLKHQSDFFQDISSKYLALVGGYAAGKTLALCYKLIYLAALNAGYEGCALSPTYQMASKVLVPTMRKCLDEMGIKYDFQLSSMVFLIQFGNYASKIHIMSAENYERCAGLNLAFFGIDEIDLIRNDIAQAAWSMLASRLRYGKVYQGCCASTPEGFNFLYQYFEENKDDHPNRRIIHADTADNPFLPPDYIDSLHENHTPEQVQAYVHGQFVNFTKDTVYYCFDRTLNHSDLTLRHLPDKSAIHIGMDFNRTQMASTEAIINAEGLPVVIGEHHGILDTETLIFKLLTRYAGRELHVYPDASGGRGTSSVTDHALLAKQGFIIHSNAANPKIMDRVSCVNAMFLNAKHGRRLLINTKECPQLTKCLERQTMVNGTPDKSQNLDHILDALGYFIIWKWPIKDAPTFKQVPLRI